MRCKQNQHDYTIAVIFLDVPDLRYDTVKLLVPQGLALLAKPELIGGVHVVQLAS